jgi:hypothetical protein
MNFLNGAPFARAQFYRSPVILRGDGRNRVWGCLKNGSLGIVVV